MAIAIEKIDPQQSGAIEFLRDRDKKLLIDGEWVSAQTGSQINSINPATGEIVATIAGGGGGDVDAAVDAASRAFRSGPWATMTPSERAKLLWRIADLMEARIDELAELETIDQGKALYVGRWAEIPGAIEQFRYFAGQATKIEGATIPSSINYQPKVNRYLPIREKKRSALLGPLSLGIPLWF